MKLLAGILLSGLCLLTSQPAHANLLPNGGFESGLTGWTVGGTGVVEVLQAGNFNPAIPPTEGTSFVLLATGPGNRGGGAGNIDGNGANELDISTLTVVFTTTAATTLSFDWDFLTSETQESGVYDDVFLVTLDGTSILNASVNKLFGGDISPFPDTSTYDGVSYSVNSPGATDNNDFGGSGSDGRTGFNSFSLDLPTAGTYTLQFVIGDQTDNLFDTGLLLDNVQVREQTDLTITKTDGATVSVPGNPITYTLTVGNAGPQDALNATVTDTFAAELTSITWTCVATGSATCTGAGSGNINDTVDVPVGDTLTYTVNATISGGASGTLVNTATVAPPAMLDDINPGDNSANDTNLLAGGNTLQLTDSLGGDLLIKSGGLVYNQHANTQPTIDEDASVVAFVSNADYNGTNGDMGSEIFVYQAGTITQATNVAAPLDFRHAANPDLSLTGQWLVFESSADLTGGNPDWNREIFRLDRQTGTLTQITSTTNCDNRGPTVRADGSRIAFDTTCTDLTAGFNADGNREVVLWSGGTIEYRETTGCTNSDASIAPNNGSWIGFVSDCNHDNNNGDGNVELFHWRGRSNSAPDQVTVSSLASGHTNQLPASEDNGRFVTFLSNADYTGNNADGNLEVFRYQRTGGGNITQLTDTFLTLNLWVDMDANADHVVFEQLDLLSGVTTTYHLDLNTSTLTVINVEPGTFPVVGEGGGNAIVVFQGTSDFTGGNVDGNFEIWRTTVP